MLLFFIGLFIFALYRLGFGDIYTLTTYEGEDFTLVDDNGLCSWGSDPDCLGIEIKLACAEELKKHPKFPEDYKTISECTYSCFGLRTCVAQLSF